MMNPLALEVMEVVARRLELRDRTVDPAARFVDDLGADSLALLELALDLETTFDVDIEIEEVENLGTVQDAVDSVERALGRRQSLQMN